MMMEHRVLESDRINWDAAKKMQKTMGHGMHEEANSVLLEPGKTGEWESPYWDVVMRSHWQSEND